MHKLLRRFGGKKIMKTLNIDCDFAINYLIFLHQNIKFASELVTCDGKPTTKSLFQGILGGQMF